MISYAGVTLRMHTPEFAEVLNSVRFLEDAATYAPPYEVAASTIDGLPKYGPAPPPRLNTLWWPTGATRWCQGWFLAMDDELEEIESKLGLQEGSGRSSYHKKEFLRFSSSEDGVTAGGISSGTGDGQEELVTSLWLLPPRRVTPIDINYGFQQCWILPLVDDRYWWQFASTPDDFEVTHDTTWSMLFSALETALTDNVEQISLGLFDPDSAYLQPDKRTFNRQNYPAAVLLEAASSSVGRRLIRKLNGNFEVQRATDAFFGVFENFEQQGVSTTDDLGGLYRLGGRMKWRSIATPNVVRVKFDCEHSVIDKYIADFELDYTLETDQTVPYVDRIKLFRTTALSGDQWTSETDALATKIAEDYFNWMEFYYHYVFNGAQRWNPTGFDDSVYWVLGYDHVTTTVQTVPPNLEVIDQYQQHPDGNIPDEGWADLTADLSVDGTATAYLVEWDADAEEYAATTVEITLHSVNGRIGFDGLRVHYKRNPDNCQLEVSCCNRQLFVVQADSTITAGSSGTFSVYDYDDTDTGINITATSRFFAFGSGAQGWAELNAEGEWEATPGECA